MSLLAILRDSLAVILGLPGLLLVLAAIFGNDGTIDLIMGKGDNEPGTNPRIAQDRLQVGLIGIVLLSIGVGLFLWH
jgi:hypothetical protein